MAPILLQIYLAVRVRLQKKGITFSRGGESFLASDFVCRRGCAPPGLPHKTVVLCRNQGGARPSQPATQNRRFADARFASCDPLALCRRLGRGMPLPFCDTKKNSGVANRVLGQEVGFRHVRHARSSRFAKSASFEKIKRLGGAWTQDRGLVNKLFDRKKYGPEKAKYI